MRANEVEALLLAVRDGTMSVETALAMLRALPFSDLGFARLDTHRELRQGFPEAIYAEGKSADEVVTIARHLLGSTSGAVIATRVPDATADALTRELPETVVHARARLAVIRPETGGHVDGMVTVVSAGTSDLAVAEEAALTAEALGAKVDRVVDVGVAGVHRLLAEQERLQKADVVVVVAGMEGALPSLIGGITGAPVIAVPTSVGYGASFEGLAALLTMLNSCAAGVVVCNIDNGFGAALAAVRVLNRTFESDR
jgi:NCAIR mutase (PurE)-related protein